MASHSDFDTPQTFWSPIQCTCNRNVTITAVCHFGPDSDLDWDTLARTFWTETLWTETFWTETFWTGTLWLETLWTKALLKTHFGPTHFGLSCFLSCSLLFFNFDIHFNVKINKLFLCLLWTRQSYMTLWRLRKKYPNIFLVYFDIKMYFRVAQSKVSRAKVSLQ